MIILGGGVCKHQIANAMMIVSEVGIGLGSLLRSSSPYLFYREAGPTIQFTLSSITLHPARVVH